MICRIGDLWRTWIILNWFIWVQVIPLIIQDQFYTIQNLQWSPIPQTSNWSGTFFVDSYSKPAQLNSRFSLSPSFKQLKQHSALQWNLIGFFCGRKKWAGKDGAPLAAIGSLSALTAGADIEAIGCISSKEWRPALLTFRRVTLLAVMSLTVTITCNHQNTFWVLGQFER